MPSVASKLLMTDWSFPYNCYEVGHTWTPSCSEAALDIGFIVFRESLKLYTPLYIISQVLSKKYDLISTSQTLKSIARSTAFLSFNGFAVIMFFCLTRRVSGKFYYLVCAYLPAFVASVMAINLERESRQGALAVYVTNVATETLYRIAVARGYFKPIQNGEVMIYTVTMSILLYLVKKNGYGHDPVSLALRFIVGTEEARKRRRRTPNDSNDPSNNGGFNLPNNGDPSSIEPVMAALPDPNSPSTSRHSPLMYTSHTKANGGGGDSPKPASRNLLTAIFHKVIQKLNERFSKHESCPHPGKSCPVYVGGAFLRPFLMGWAGQTLLMTLRRPQKFIKHPSVLWENMLSGRSVKFGLFLGCFTAVFKGVNCALRWGCDGARDWHGFVGGLTAGPMMLWSPNTPITLYLMWKCIETLYCIGARRGWIPLVKPTIHALYAISTAQLFYAAVLEPKHMKPSYMRFLDRMTDHRLHLLNRIILDVFGTDASAGYEDWFPNLDFTHTSKHFQETVLMWLL